MLVSDKNFDQVLLELKEYLGNSDQRRFATTLKTLWWFFRGQVEVWKSIFFQLGSPQIKPWNPVGNIFSTWKLWKLKKPWNPETHNSPSSVRLQCFREFPAGKFDMEVLLTWSKILGLGKWLGCFLFVFYVFNIFCLKFEGHVFRVQFNICTPRDKRHTIKNICFSIRSCYIATHIHILSYSICLFVFRYIHIFLSILWIAYVVYHELLSKSAYMCISVFTSFTSFKFSYYVNTEKDLLAQSLVAHNQGYRVTSLHMGDGWVTP